MSFFNAGDEDDPVSHPKIFASFGTCPISHSFHEVCAVEVRGIEPKSATLF